MSEENGATPTGAMISIIGFVLLVLGLMLTYFSLVTSAGITDPRFFTPLGILISLIGLFMIVTKKV